ncbi:hypothetical protein Tco_0758718 [Tanacetum coccineum]
MSVVSVLAPMETMLYLLHMYCSLPPEETWCSLPHEERLVVPYLLRRLAAPYLLRRLAAPYLLRRLGAPYLLMRLVVPYLLTRHYSLVISFGPEVAFVTPAIPVDRPTWSVFVLILGINNSENLSNVSFKNEREKNADSFGSSMPDATKKYRLINKSSEARSSKPSNEKGDEIMSYFQSYKCSGCKDNIDLVGDSHLVCSISYKSRVSIRENTRFRPGPWPKVCTSRVSNSGSKVLIGGMSSRSEVFPLEVHEERLRWRFMRAPPSYVHESRLIR